MVVKCEVCDDNGFKYKCPKCLIKYCSVACFKLHKETKCATPEKEQPPQTAEVDGKQSLEKAPVAVTRRAATGTTSDTVSLECLQRLGTSDEVKDLLANPHLRDLVRHVNSADNTQLAIDEVMKEPIFLEFADACLSVVEPDTEAASIEQVPVCSEDET